MFLGAESVMRTGVQGGGAAAVAVVAEGGTAAVWKAMP